MLVREGWIYYASSARSKFKDVLAVGPTALFQCAEDEFTRHGAAAEEPVLVTVGVVVMDVKPEEAWRDPLDQAWDAPAVPVSMADVDQIVH